MGRNQKGLGGDRYEGCFGNVFGIQPQSKMDHGGVSHDAGQANLGRKNPCALRHPLDQSIDLDENFILQALEVRGIFQGELDAGDHVRSECSLGVELGLGIQMLSGMQIKQIRCHCSSSNIDGHPAGLG